MTVPDAERLLRSRVCQAVAVALAVCLVGAMHGRNDGLWFQGDAPRHAANGLFWWDLLSAMPADPVTYAVRYYARYPIIAPATYPPLFYVLEGLAFAVAGPTPYAARILVLLFAGLAGLYTMAWARRWIGPGAGWAGSVLVFLPGVAIWSNAVMLNIPATALGLAWLYHVRRWFEAPGRTHLVAAIMSFIALVLTYYQGASVLLVGLAWAMFIRRDSPVRAIHLPYLVIAAGIAIVPLGLALYLAPVQMARHLPSVASLETATTWMFYWRVLPGLVGSAWLALGAAGLACGLLEPRWRVEAGYLAAWIGALLIGFTLLPAKNPRYVLLVAPAFVLAVALGLAAAAKRLPAIRPGIRGAMLAAGLALGLWSASRVHVISVSGFREVADYLRRQGPADAVLYDGHYDGLFGFFARASDPQFARRIVRADKLLYEFGPTTTFRPVETAKVSNVDEVLTAVRAKCGCRWVAVEVDPSARLRDSQRLLREALARPAFERAASFPITGSKVRRVDVYKVLGAIEPVTSIDLEFPAFSSRTFNRVIPITR